MRIILLAAAAALVMTVSAQADAIEGNWRTESGESARIAPCSGGLCITLTTGAHSGRQIGQMENFQQNRYRGTITDPANDRTYSGNATLSGNTLSMQGCMAAIFCRTQTWSRQ